MEHKLSIFIDPIVKIWFGASGHGSTAKTPTFFSIRMKIHFAGSTMCKPVSFVFLSVRSPTWKCVG